MNAPLLKGLMVSNGDTQEKLAEFLGISLSRFNAKLNERDGAAFTQPEITAMVERYHMNSETAMAVFFTPKSI